MALVDYFNSNFWIKTKSIGSMVWLATFLAASYKGYKAFGKPKTRMSKLLSTTFLGLEFSDIVLDFSYLYTVPHNLGISLAFSQAMVIPFLMNIWATNVVEFTDKDGKELTVDENELLVKTFFTHIGLE